MLTYAAALTDGNLLGALSCFANPASWSRWCVFLKAVEGLPLTSDEQAIFRRHTGRSVYAPPAGGFREVLAVCGRQSGKSQVAGAIQAVDALRSGPGTYAVTLAQDSRAAMRTVFGYAAAAFDAVPLLRQRVAGRTQDSVTLTNGATLTVYPCRPSALRGIRASVVTLDEAAFFVSSEGRAVDAEMLRAARPATLTTGGRIVILSSPYGQNGIVYDLFRKHYGQDASPVLVWRGTSSEMNPTLNPTDLARLREEDPEAYENEIRAEFRSGLSSAFDADAVDAVVDAGVRERPRVSGVAPVAGCDISGGRRDRAAVAVAHREGDHAVLDAVRVWSPPFDPASVVAEASAFVQTYGCRSVVGDNYAAEFTVGAFKAAGITYQAADRDRSAVYLALLPLVNSGRVRLLDHPLLLRELKTLERRTGRGGRDRVDHRVGSHDDVANAVALALTEAHRRASRGSGRMVDVFTGRAVEPWWPTDEYDHPDLFQ